MELQNSVKEAVNALYNHPDDAARMQADAWLRKFQHTLDAWQVADNLLHEESSNLETLIFCSQTLRSKVLTDFEELPSRAFPKLKSSLTTLLKKFNGGPLKVRTQICIAVAGLAVQVPEDEWGRGGILAWVVDEMNLHPEYSPGFLELLAILPEEVCNYKIAARPERRNQFEAELSSKTDVALGILTACLKFDELKEQVHEAFVSWLRLRPRIPGSMLASHPLVLSALSGLDSGEQSEAAVNVISELIYYTTEAKSGGISEHMPLIQVVVPRIMNLKGQLRDSSKDEDDVKAIARVFTDLGDSYVDLLVTGSDESMIIVEALLEVASHPDYDIASMTFNFWHNLQISLTKCDSSSYDPGHEGFIETERGRRRRSFFVFQSTYGSLLSLVTHRVQYPKDYQDLSLKDQKEFKQTRCDFADVLKDAAVILGGHGALKLLYNKLAEDRVSWRNGVCEWHPVEASLFCIMSISNYALPVEKEEEEEGVLAKIMSLLLELPPYESLLLQTSCLTIGAYSKWFSSSSDGFSLISSVMKLLLHAMAESEDSAAAAAVAFRDICVDCRRKLSGYFDDLFSMYHFSLVDESNCKIIAEDSLLIVEALSSVISVLPLDEAKDGILKLSLPIFTLLQEAINHGRQFFEKKPARELTVLIDRLAYIFRYVNHPQAVAEIVHMHWSIFNAIFDLRAWDMQTMESLCRACKYVVRSCGKLMGTIIGAMLEEIQGLYQQHHQPCFLYLSSEVIKIFGSEPTCACYLQKLIEALFLHTTCLLPQLADFTSRPDVADDCFLFASRCVRYCPHIFVPSSVFPSLLDCSLVGITVQHREASDSILAFLSNIFDLTKFTIGEPYLSIRDSIVIPRGSAITRLLIALLTGALPRSRFDSVTYPLFALVRAYGVAALEWVRHTLLLIPLTVVKEAERARCLKAFSDAASASDISLLATPVHEFCDICMRNRTVMEIVQGALKPLDLNVVFITQ